MWISIADTPFLTIAKSGRPQATRRYTRTSSPRRIAFSNWRSTPSLQWPSPGLHQFIEPVEQGINIAVETIWCEASAGGTFDAKGADQRLSAMVAPAQRYTVTVKMAADFRGGECVDGK